MILTVLSCGKKATEEEVPDEQITLYHQTLRLIQVYSDSLKYAVDSVETIDIFSRFNSKLDSLNFTVSPDTDLKLSEGENDTLFNCIQKIRHYYDDKLLMLAKSYNFTEIENDTCQPSTTL